jgi:hypothetical protein
LRAKKATADRQSQGFQTCSFAKAWAKRQKSSLRTAIVFLERLSCSFLRFSCRLAFTEAHLSFYEWHKLSATDFARRKPVLSVGAIIETMTVTGTVIFKKNEFGADVLNMYNLAVDKIA